MRALTLGHSPDADDAFMFYALAEGRIDTRGYRFEHVLQDIQTLNERAMRGELDITAVSVHACAYVLDRYAVLGSGASMGDGYGPVVIAAADCPAAGAPDGEVRRWLAGRRVAVPGKMTSAHLAMRLYAPSFEEVVVPFDRVFEAVRTGEADAGVIIHEGQLTWGRDGFGCLRDLGAWWKEETGLPLPLGCNVIRRDLPPPDQEAVAAVLRESIRYGLEHRAPAVAHAMRFGRGLDAADADRFIGMYVNHYTLEYGETGRRAVREFLARAAVAGLAPPVPEIAFVG